MTAKKILFDDIAFKALLSGINSVSKTVSCTLGPVGRNVVLERKFQTPQICSDGVSIAKEIDLLDPFENMGAQLVKIAAVKTNELVGDGTTTSIILANFMSNRGFQFVASGVDGTALKRGINKAVNVVSEYLNSISVPVTTREQIFHVASLAAHEDAIGNLISDSIGKVGRNGSINIEESKGMYDFIEYVEGMNFDRGFIVSDFVNNDAGTESIIDNPYILITELKLTSSLDIVPVLELLYKYNVRDLVIIAEDVDKDALAALLLNSSTKKIFKTVAVRSPNIGDRRSAIMKDIAVFTNGVVVNKELGVSLKNISISHFGRAKKVIVTKNSTSIIGGFGSIESIKSRINQIKSQIPSTTSDFDRGLLEERISKLSGGVAVIKVGAVSEVEFRERKMRVEDALFATKSAIEEGIVPGGSVSLIRAMPNLSPLLKDPSLSVDERFGVQIVIEALEVPLIHIINNSDIYNIDGSVIVDQVKNSPFGWGFDVEKGVFCDLFNVGIVDPVKVLKISLQNAASVASMLLTTGAALADVKNYGEKIT